MKKYFLNQSGFASSVIVLIIAVVSIGGYLIYRQSMSDPAGDEKMMETAMDKEGRAIKETPSVSAKTEASPNPDSVMKNGMSKEADTMMEVKFSGQVLAGTKSPLLDFSKSDYDKAIVSNKLIVLYFYANWCPICRAEFPKMQGAFNSLSDENIIGFRVNFNDNQTDNDEKELAREFGVAYQHTKVLINNGQRVLKAPESWESADVYISKINQYK